MSEPQEFKSFAPEAALHGFVVNPEDVPTVKREGSEVWFEWNPTQEEPSDSIPAESSSSMAGIQELTLRVDAETVFYFTDGI